MEDQFFLLYIVSCSNRHWVDGIIRLWEVDTGMRELSWGYGYGEDYWDVADWVGLGTRGDWRSSNAGMEGVRAVRGG